MTDRELLGKLVANVQRESLDYFEIAKTISKLNKEGMRKQDIAKQCGKSAGWVTHYLSPENAPECIVNAIKKKLISDIFVISGLTKIYKDKPDEIELTMREIIENEQEFTRLSFEKLKDDLGLNEEKTENTQSNENSNENDKDDENERADATPTNILTTINSPLNQILYGPPGTGKTYNTINKALEILGVEIENKEREELKATFDEFRQNGQIEFITFHQSFSYEEFVEGIKPIFVNENGEEVKHSKNMIYKAKNGIFKDICKRALENSQKPYILIIDEINRGNISKILGELITLIEPSKRIRASQEEKERGIGDESLEVTLPYSNENFGVPSNLYIIGTMNTADRSIALLDTVLRRRFEFVEMMPQPELLEIIKVENGEINLQLLLEKMNARIEFLLDREHTIGHSFFINVKSLSELQQVFKNKIIPLLQEYFYDDYKKIQAVLNDNQMIQSKSKPDFLNKFHDEIDSEKDVYAITDFEQWDEGSFMQIYENHQ